MSSPNEFDQLIKDVKARFSTCQDTDAINCFNQRMRLITNMVQATKDLVGVVPVSFNLSCSIELITADKKVFSSDVECFEIRLENYETNDIIWHCRVFLGLFEDDGNAHSKEEGCRLLDQIEHPVEKGILDPLRLTFGLDNADIPVLINENDILGCVFSEDRVYLSFLVDKDVYLQTMLQTKEQHPLH